MLVELMLYGKGTLHDVDALADALCTCRIWRIGRTIEQFYTATPTCNEL
jgi:hypothetical protein